MAVESNFSNVGYGDRDSEGVLQQRPSQGWGSAAEPAAMDIRQFLARARQADRGFRGTPGQLAQAVQRSAFPARYDQRMSEVLAILGGGAAPGGAPMALSGEPDAAANARRVFALHALREPKLTTEGLLGALRARQDALRASLSAEPAGTSASLSEPAAGQEASVRGHGGADTRVDETGGTLMWLTRYIKPHRLVVTSTTGGKHVDDSYHYSKRAVDVAGSQQELMALAQRVKRQPWLFREFFYTPAGFFVKDGKVYPISQLNAKDAAGHRGHAHLAR
jgi:hypothetical protein